MLYGCGNNTSKQIYSGDSPILCCPTQVPNVAEPVEVQIAFSHILWKTDKCWKMSGFTEGSSVTAENIPLHWKVAINEKRVVAITDLGSIKLWEDVGIWRDLHFQTNIEMPGKSCDLEEKNILGKDSECKASQCKSDCENSRNLFNDELMNSSRTQAIANVEESVASGNAAEEFSWNSTHGHKSLPSDTNRNVKFQKVSCEDGIFLCLDKEGVVYCGNVPLPVKHRFTDIAVGKEHNIALTDSGVVFTWGSGMRGQLGNGEIRQDDHPTPVNNLQGLTICSIACGGWHSVVVSNSGDLYVWGWNESGQLGLPTKTPCNKPAFGSFEYICQCPVTPSRNIHQKGKMKEDSNSILDPKTQTAVETGQKDSSLAKLKPQSADPRINVNRCNDEVNVQASPLLLDYWCEGISVKKVACGDRHSLFLLDDGSAWSAGMNKYGQLGLGHTNPLNEPSEIPLKNVVSIYAGGWNSVFITR